MCVRFRERNDARERELFLSKLLCLMDDFFAIFFLLLFSILSLGEEKYHHHHGENRNGETAESAEEEAERTGRGRFSGVGEEERGAGEVERAEEASRRWREVR